MNEKEFLTLMDSKVSGCEDDLRNEQDFDLEDIPVYLDGIKWFVQEWLPNHLEGFKFNE